MKHARLPRIPFPATLHPEQPLDPAVPVRLPLEPGERIDLEHTFGCGQIFRWRQVGETWYGPFGGASLAVRLSGEAVEVRAAGVRVTAGEAWRFLGLDAPLAEIERRLAADRWVWTAMRALPGLRILRQDPWDCVASYVCSQWNNIPKIELSTGRIAERWGRVHRWPEGVEVASFPPPETLAAHPPEALRESALGYRCGYLTETAHRVAEGEIDLEGLRTVPYPEALAALLRLPGVGRKVADCILLFSLDKPEACPIDVWVRRVLHELYPRALSRYFTGAVPSEAQPLTAREHVALVRFAWDRWGCLAGYAQQYLFHARRLGVIGPAVFAGRNPQESIG